jgi:hypothetical protein
MFMGLSGVLPWRWVGGPKGAGRKRAERPGAARIGLEELERRELPSAAASAVVITGLTQQYGGQSQTETFTAQVTSQGAPVAGSPITFTDGGHIQTVSTNASGMATATFTFNIFQELPKAHTVTAAFAGNSSVASSSASVTTPDTTQLYYAQLFYNYTLLVVFDPGLAPVLAGFIQGY